MENSSLEEREIAYAARGQQVDVEVSDDHCAQRDPRPHHVTGIQLRDQRPHLVPDRMLTEVSDPSAYGVAAGVTRQAVQPQAGRIHGEEDGTETHVTPLAVVIAEGKNRIPGQDHIENQAKVEGVAVQVIQDQRKATLTGVLTVRLSDGTRRRRQPERTEVRLAVVITGEAEGQRNPCHQ